MNNPYEGQWAGRQLTESVGEFLERLPPATTPVSEDLPWIYIANPFVSPKSYGQNDDDDDDLDAPLDDHEDWPQFILLGGILLEELSETKKTIELEKKDRTGATIAAAITKEKNAVVQKIHELAVRMKCTSGKVWP